MKNLEPKSRQEVAQIYEISNETLAGWVRQGLIKPFQEARGRGSARRFDHRNLAECGIILALQSSGFNLRKIGIILDEIRKWNNKNRDIKDNFYDAAHLNLYFFEYIPLNSKNQNKTDWQNHEYEIAESIHSEYSDNPLLKNAVERLKRTETVILFDIENWNGPIKDRFYLTIINLGNIKRLVYYRLQDL